jgi:multicomponent Na+:H+ antiporter subunit D
MIAKHLPILLPVLYLVAAFTIPLGYAVRKTLPYWISVGTTFIVCALSVYGFLHVSDHGTIRYSLGGWNPQIGIGYVYDALAAFFGMVINLIAFWVVVHSKHPVDRELTGKRMPYYAVLMILLAGFNGIVITGDLFNLFVFIEIASLSAYGLIGVGGRMAPLAAFRYLIIGTIGASFILLGIAYLYFSSGTLNMEDFALMEPALSGSRAITVALALIVAGVVIKMAIVPMHGWLPDAYTHAPSTTSALLAGLGTKVSAYILVRVLFFLFGTDYLATHLPLTSILAVLSAIGILYGSFKAIAQTNLKRMLAYSSIGQIGYIGLGIALANPLCFVGAVLHVINHAFMKSCLFLVASNLQQWTGNANTECFNRSYSKRFPLTMLAFAIASLSMIGLPPFAGFFSKWYLILGILEEGKWPFIVVLVISSLLSAVYFFRILEKVYLRSGDQAETEETSGNEVPEHKSQPDFSMVIPTVILGSAVVLLGVFNTVIVHELFKVAQQIFNL